MASTSRGTDQAVSFLARILLRMFGRPQGVLGRLGGIIMARMNRNLAGRTIALLDVQPHDRVLEIGFGPGVGIELLSGVVSSGHVAGVDVSEEMVEQARIRNVEAIQRGKVELRRGSVEAPDATTGTTSAIPTTPARMSIA
jgi:SAM-dependent methyltransferase